MGWIITQYSADRRHVVRSQVCATYYEAYIIECVWSAQMPPCTINVYPVP